MTEPVEAATVILVRRGVPVGTPWQCFMVRRHVKSEFAADVFVFPGGKVDRSDRSEELLRFSVGHPGSPPEDVETWRSTRLAAIRELFEEAGVLIARHRDRGPLTGDEVAGTHLAEYRRALQRNETTLLEIARCEDLEYPLDELQQISRWITPEGFPRRFDTHFFVARLPHGQEPIHDSQETTESIWIAPREGLSRNDAGEFPLVFPTRKHLERLAHHHSIEELIASVTPADLDPIMPRLIKDEGGERFVLPGEPGY